MKMLLIILNFILGSATFAASPCEDLAKLSCGTGGANDGTGLVKSEEQVQEELDSFAAESKVEIKKKFQQLIDNPENVYFRNLAMSALGLKGNPICESKELSMKALCATNLINGLTTSGTKKALGNLVPTPDLTRDGNFRDMQDLILNSHFKKVVEGIKESARKKLVDQEVVKNIENNVFPKVKKEIINRLDNLNISKEQKEFMKSKINSIEFDGTKCDDPANSGSETISQLFQPNAMYYIRRNIFKFCDGYVLQASSEFQIATTIAHELSHSIDPCNIAVGPEDFGFKYSDKKDFIKMEKEYPLSNVIQCLRSENSVNAHNYQFEDLQSAKIPETPDDKTTPNFCENDQIGESFCDWMASEVVPSYIENNHKLTTEQYQLGYINARKVICEIKTKYGRLEAAKKENRGEHPLMEDRINKIIMVNSKVRAQMKCPPLQGKTVYCDANNEYRGPYESKTNPKEATVTPTESQVQPIATPAGVNK